MKNSFLSLFFFFSISISFGQSVTITPNTASSVTIKKTGIGLDHTDDTGAIRVGTYSSSAGAYIQTHSSHPLRFSTANGSTQAILLTNGNFGIGNVAPAEKLHVNGNIRVTPLAGTGKREVYTDANGILININPVAFSAFQNTNFSVAPNSTITIPFNTPNYDLSSNFNNTTGVFTAPTNGIYHFNTTIIWSSLSASSDAFQVALYGSTPLFTLAQHTTAITLANNFSTSIATTDVKLNAGQTVRVNVFQTTSISLAIRGDFNDYTCIFSGHLVTAL